MILHIFTPFASQTFGGSPVACEVGIAVLDAIESDGLRANATRVGNALRRGFLALQRNAATQGRIGDVRGCGLFLGLEMVRPLSSSSTPPLLTPDAAAADAAVHHLRICEHVLASTDGPHHNVIKLKPPMCISMQDAAHVVAAVERALKFICAQPIQRTYID
jgi:4-aminobutyrate aminotransferase-like enzyme